MKIIVCIKQVPATSEVRMDPERGVLLRDSAESRLNPYDAVAVEAALRLRRDGDCITALSMGPNSAESVLRFAYAMGVDNCTLLCDRAFAGADVLSTARALSQAILALGGADLIVCGRQTTDGDTAQVGPALAAFLDMPCVGWAQQFEWQDDSFQACQMLTGGRLTVLAKLPCVLMADKDSCVPRAPSLRRKLISSKIEIPHLTLESLPKSNSNLYGLAGSATSVRRIFPPERAVLGQQITGSTENLALFLCDAVNSVRKEGRL